MPDFDRAAAEAALTALRAELDADMSTIVVRDLNGGFRVVAASGVERFDLHRLRLDAGNVSPTAVAAYYSWGIIFAQRSSWAHDQDSGLMEAIGAASSIAIALRVNAGELLGVLGVHSRLPGKFNRDAIHVLEQRAKGIRDASWPGNST